MNRTKQKSPKPSDWQPLFDALQAFEPDFHIKRDQPSITPPDKKPRRPRKRRTSHALRLCDLQLLNEPPAPYLSAT